MILQFNDLKKIVQGDELQVADRSKPVVHLLTDSRKLAPPRNALFFAISGKRHEGHDYISDLIKAGVKQFIVEKPINIEDKNVNVLHVKSSLEALQKIAAYRRSQYKLDVVGITGSNGKTIVKEWLGQLLSPHRSVIKSPGSFNSQIGVPLSIWKIEPEHDIALIEAGISQKHEMQKLEKIIKPTLGIFTNIGSAHDEGFESMEEKVKEKSLLFQQAKTVIYCKDNELIDAVFYDKGFTWGYHEASDIKIKNLKKTEGDTQLTITYLNKSYEFRIPVVNRAGIENALHCIAFMLMYQYSARQIQEGLTQLRTVPMRLQLKRGLNNCLLIDDTYNNDPAGLQVALDFLSSQKQRKKKTIILSDLLQTGLKKDHLYKGIMEQLRTAGLHRVITVGPDTSIHFQHEEHIETFPSTEAFLKDFDFQQFENELVLIKGARTFRFERIVKALEEKIHGTQLEINLEALTHNLNFYLSRLHTNTKMMVMVKAFAYGSGSLEIANLLQHHRIDYLGVAYADEGVALRKNGIEIPIMVMNPSADSFDKLMEFDLEPEIYNLTILKKFIDFIGSKNANIHLKINTGMHRLGFNESELDELISLLQKNKQLKVKSIFSHLAGADDEAHNLFSKKQASVFEQLSERIMKSLQIKALRHLVNSPGIVRFPEYHYDMVRLGIGLYGIETNNQEQEKLEAISSLKTIVSQVNKLKKGETVGYGRKGLVDEDKLVATIAIGYADGFSRAFSNGVGQVFIHGKRAPVIGNVCMDMTMVDVTLIDGVKAGDEVEVFGPNLPITEIAQAIDTIPYEILTNVSQRVKRVYYTG